MTELIKLARQRNTGYSVRYLVDGTKKQWSWSASRNGKHDIKSVPREVVDWLTMETNCFDTGQLKIVEAVVEKDIKDSILDVEKYENNTNDSEAILKILKGNVNKMKTELKKITIDSEKAFVIDVANGIKDDLTKGKIDILAEFMNVSSDILFED